MPAPMPVAEDGVDSEAGGAIALDELQVDVVEFIDLDNRLPIGLVLGGKDLRRIQFKEFSGEVEVKVGRYLSDAGANNKKFMDAALWQCMSVLVEAIGTDDGEFFAIEDLTAQFFRKQPSRFFDAMPFANVITLLLMGRIHVQKDDGFEMVLNTKCGMKGCSERFSRAIDISGMDVGVLRNKLSAPLAIAVPLDGFTMYAGTSREETITGVELSPVTLRGMKTMLSSTSKEDERLQEIQQMVTAVHGANSMGNLKPGQLMPTDYWVKLIDNRADRERVMEAHKSLGLHKLGPKLTIPMECACPTAFEWEVMVPWRDLASFWFDSSVAV